MTTVSRGRPVGHRFHARRVRGTVNAPKSDALRAPWRAANAVSPWPSRVDGCVVCSHWNKARIGIRILPK